VDGYGSYLDRTRRMREIREMRGIAIRRMSFLR
jgi:hypothetical protein